MLYATRDKLVLNLPDPAHSVARVDGGRELSRCPV